MAIDNDTNDTPTTHPSSTATSGCLTINNDELPPGGMPTRHQTMSVGTPATGAAAVAPSAPTESFRGFTPADAAQDFFQDPPESERRFAKLPSSPGRHSQQYLYDEKKIEEEEDILVDSDELKVGNNGSGAGDRPWYKTRCFVLSLIAGLFVVVAGGAVGTAMALGGGGSSGGSSPASSPGGGGGSSSECQIKFTNEPCASDNEKDCVDSCGCLQECTATLDCSNDCLCAASQELTFFPTAVTACAGAGCTDDNFGTCYYDVCEFHCSDMFPEASWSQCKDICACKGNCLLQDGGSDCSTACVCDTLGFDGFKSGVVCGGDIVAPEIEGGATDQETCDLFRSTQDFKEAAVTCWVAECDNYEENLPCYFDTCEAECVDMLGGTPAQCQDVCQCTTGCFIGNELDDALACMDRCACDNVPSLDNDNSQGGVACRPPSTTYAEQFAATSGALAVQQPQCDAWNNFLQSIPASGSFSSITIKGSLDPVGVTCDVPAYATDLCQGLANGNQTLSRFCNGRLWTLEPGCRGSGNATGLELSASGRCNCFNTTGYTVSPCLPEFGAVGHNRTCSLQTQKMEVVCEVAAPATTSLPTPVPTPAPAPAPTPAPTSFATTTSTTALSTVLPTPAPTSLGTTVPLTPAPTSTGTSSGTSAPTPFGLNVTKHPMFPVTNPPTSSP